MVKYLNITGICFRRTRGEDSVQGAGSRPYGYSCALRREKKLLGVEIIVRRKVERYRWNAEAV